MEQRQASDADFICDLGALLARARSANGLLDGLGLLLKNNGVEGYWLGSAEPDGRIVCEYASSDEMAAYFASLHLRWDEGPWAQGPAGQAVRTGYPCFMLDWQRISGTEPWQASLARFGWQSSAALPLCVGKHTKILALYSRRPDTFGGPDHRVRIEALTGLIGAALGREAVLVAEHRRLERLALHDPLTDLPNRAALDQRLEGAPARAVGGERLLVVSMLDLDDFKSINDTHGHTAGDVLLCEIARRIKAGLRQNDFVARLGGDEFVIVFEDIEDLDDLEALLARLHEAIIQPIALEKDIQARIDASLGVIVYPLCGGYGDDANALLRAADQAMYVAKAQKATRLRWWSLFDGSQPLATASASQGEEFPSFRVPAPYSPAAQAILARQHADMLAWVAVFGAAFYAHFATSPEGRPIQELSQAEQHRQREALMAHLRWLLDPGLQETTHRQAALRLGRAHAMMGIEPSWLVEAYGLLTAELHSALPHTRPGHAILSLRISVDLQAQLEGYAAIHAARGEAMRRMDALIMRATHFAELAQGTVDVLAALDEVAAVTIGRPDMHGRYTFEFAAGEVFKTYLQALAEGRARPIETGPSAEGQGPTGRAWHSGEIEHCLNYATDPRMEPWRDFALASGIRSLAAIPIAPPDGPVRAVLTLYCPYPGGFSGDEQRRMLDHLRQLLGFTLPRLGMAAPAPLGFEARLRCRELLERGALIMHYQPIIELRSGRTIGVEALARLREDSGALVSPGQFLPTLTDDDLCLLFEMGLFQALDALTSWKAAGHDLMVSVNLPAQGLSDSRYFRLVKGMLTDRDLGPDRLRLELLESEEAADFAVRDRAIADFKALGVQLAEDDLGSGYSSLLRLDRLPFDAVKIDQGLVCSHTGDPMRTLAFMRHLTRLAQDMGKQVVVEGLETPALLEAAALFGADHGQGYAIARPMPAQDVPAWIDNHHTRMVLDRPATALGALAVFMDNAGCAARLADAAHGADDSETLTRFCQANNPVHRYIVGLGARGAPLAQACDRLMALSARGYIDEAFEQARFEMKRLLIERIQQES